MEVTRIPYTKDFDSRVVDAARVSFKKKAENYTEEQNSKLIKYLIKHNHLSPFFHSHLTFLVDCSWDDLEDVITNKRLMAGLNISTVNEGKIISGSLWALLELIKLRIGFDDLEYEIRYKANKTVSNALSEPVWSNHIHDITLVEFITDPKHNYKTLHIKNPIFIERQMIKHQLDFGFSFPLELAKNEVSRRYVSDDPEFYTPDNWRKASKNKKQGSCEDEFVDWEPVLQHPITGEYVPYHEVGKYLYIEGIGEAVSPEQVRMIPPQSMYTEYYLTGNMDAWNRLIGLREDPHAQKEIRDLAAMIKEELKDD